MSTFVAHISDRLRERAWAVGFATALATAATFRPAPATLTQRERIVTPVALPPHLPRIHAPRRRRSHGLAITPCATGMMAPPMAHYRSSPTNFPRHLIRSQPTCASFVRLLFSPCSQRQTLWRPSNRFPIPFHRLESRMPQLACSSTGDSTNPSGRRPTA